MSAEGVDLPCHPVYKLPCVVVFVLCNEKTNLRAARGVTDTSDSVQWDTSCIHRNRIIDLAEVVTLRAQVEISPFITMRRAQEPDH